MLRVAILSEASAEVGLGHLVRCGALGGLFLEAGWKVAYWVRGGLDETFLRNVIEDAQGAATVELHAEDWLLSVEKGQSAAWGECDFWVWDSYALTQKHVIEIERMEVGSLFVDDWHHWQYTRSWALDWSVSASQVVPAHWHAMGKHAMIGVEWVVVRPPFRTYTCMACGGELQRIFVMVGGTDVGGWVGRLVNALARAWAEVEFVVVTPREEVTLYENVHRYAWLTAAELAQFMGRSDIAIIGAGQTMYEALSIGVPFVPLVVVENQRVDAEVMVAEGWVHSYVEAWQGDEESVLRGVHEELVWHSRKENREEVQCKYAELRRKSGVSLRSSFIDSLATSIEGKWR